SAGFEAPPPLRFSYVVTPASPTLTIASPANPVANQPIAIGVSVARMGDRYPTGVVSISVDGTSIGGTVPLVNGLAMVNYSGAFGPHVVTATYTGDNFFTQAIAQPVTFIAKGTTSVSVSPDSGSPVYGQASSFTVTVGAGGRTVTGTADCFADGVKLNPVPLAISGGKVKFGPFQLHAGTYSITAQYNGDQNNLPSSSSPPLAFTVKQAATQIAALQLPAAPVYGPLKFTVLVEAASPGAGIPGGQIMLSDGGTTVGSAPLLSGTAAVTVPSLAAGPHLLSAVYNGDSDFLGASSAPARLTVAKATPELAVQASPASAVVAG